MGHYSFIVIAADEVPIPDYMMYLEPGRNVFNVVLRTDLETFTNFLTDHGVQIVQTNRLDVFEPVTAEDQRQHGLDWPDDLNALLDGPKRSPLLPG
jgi:hypothetical protein